AESYLEQWGVSLSYPHIQFAYLTNAYRFYSPEPGPAALLWYYIEYDDGSSRWLRIPNREEHDLDPLGQEYTRRLSIAESVNVIVPSPVEPVLQARVFAERPGLLVEDETEPGKTKTVPIPRHPELGLDMQYQVPAEHCKRLLCEYARFVAQHYPSEKNPSAKPVRVKIYRVVHRMLDPNEMGSTWETPD